MKSVLIVSSVVLLALVIGVVVYNQNQLHPVQFSASTNLLLRAGLLVSSFGCSIFLYGQSADKVKAS